MGDNPIAPTSGSPCISTPSVEPTRNSLNSLGHCSQTMVISDLEAQKAARKLGKARSVSFADDMLSSLMEGTPDVAPSFIAFEVLHEPSDDQEEVVVQCVPDCPSSRATEFQYPSDPSGTAYYNIEEADALSIPSDCPPTFCNPTQDGVSSGSSELMKHF